MILGLTGGIGCGKSIVGKHLKQLGLRHLDTDRTAREVVRLGSDGLTRVLQAFGTSVSTPSGELDRVKLGEIVFKDPEKRRRLEAILHPLILERVTNFVEEARKEDLHAVVEIPLLYEKGREELFDEVWVVATTRELQNERLAHRNGWSQEQIEERLSSQMPLDDKIERADTVIWNVGTLEELRESVSEAWKRALRKRED